MNRKRALEIVDKLDRHVNKMIAINLITNAIMKSDGDEITMKRCANSVPSIIARNRPWKGAA